MFRQFLFRFLLVFFCWFTRELNDISFTVVNFDFRFSIFYFSFIRFYYFHFLVQMFFAIFCFGCSFYLFSFNRLNIDTNTTISISHINGEPCTHLTCMLISRMRWHDWALDRNAHTNALVGSRWITSRSQLTTESIACVRWMLFFFVAVVAVARLQLLLLSYCRFCLTMSLPLFYHFAFTMFACSSALAFRTASMKR